MSADISVRVTGRAGRITLQRPEALNAMSHEMCLQIEAALDAWRDDPAVDLVVVDADGDRAFCAGGDLDQMYRSGTAGDWDYGRRFWRDEYRLNAKIASYPKPYVALMQGFTMGGGVGISCHGTHRVVCETSQIAMPECGIGLVPDVGGTYILANAPGHSGEYVGATGYRMGPADAIHMGFADTFVPREFWTDMTADLEQTGDPVAISLRVQTAGDAALAAVQKQIDAHFGAETGPDLALSIGSDPSDWAREAAKRLARQSPLSVCVTLGVIRHVRSNNSMGAALAAEYRYTHRCMEYGDFLEGIRAQIIDKDRNPQWRHSGIADVPDADVARMTANLGDDELQLTGQDT